jgi:hypothetical protein
MNSVEDVLEDVVGAEAFGFAFEVQQQAVAQGGDGGFLDVVEADVVAAVEHGVHLCGERDRLGAARAEPQRTYLLTCRSRGRRCGCVASTARMA